ncbi:MAG: hypothetical protein MUF07_13030 [Steroidobacteraceae bacterium]|nr:hypothetical protein [Steroidobacteraceae bacterium]
MLLPLGGCDPGAPPPVAQREVAAVSVLPAALELRAGETAQLAAQANDAAGQPVGGAEIEFASGTRAVADVTRDGLVTATGPVGSAQLRVASGRAESVVPVTVVAGRPQALNLRLPLPATAAAGAVVDVPVQVLDAFGNAVAGVQVQFAVQSGKGRVALPVVSADAAGTARVQWTLGAGEQVLEARVAGLAPLLLRTSAGEPGLAAPSPTVASPAPGTPRP